MRQVTFLCERALNSIEHMSIEDLFKLQEMAKEDFNEAFKDLCETEGEGIRDVNYYFKYILKDVERHPVPYDNEHVHAVTHVEKHRGELDTNQLTNERWEYLITSFGLAMRLSCQLYLNAQELIKRKSS